MRRLRTKNVTIQGIDIVLNSTRTSTAKEFQHVEKLYKYFVFQLKTADSAHSLPGMFTVAQNTQQCKQWISGYSFLHERARKKERLGMSNDYYT